MTYGGMTFREVIDNNKRNILEYLGDGKKFTADICQNYKGEKEMPAVRKALNELRKEGKIEADDRVRMFRGKMWWAVTAKDNVL